MRSASASRSVRATSDDAARRLLRAFGRGRGRVGAASCASRAMTAISSLRRSRLAAMSAAAFTVASSAAIRATSAASAARFRQPHGLPLARSFRAHRSAIGAGAQSRTGQMTDRRAGRRQSPPAREYWLRRRQRHTGSGVAVAFLADRRLPARPRLRLLFGGLRPCRGGCAGRGRLISVAFRSMVGVGRLPADRGCRRSFAAVSCRENREKMRSHPEESTLGRSKPFDIRPPHGGN